ncbi:hypothetical protein [Acidaminococcus fermentans]|uniref:hypothetical protein n=1 Tax=Acidaminococcus fermentans TaxID=905 RepID=UPI00242D2D65|nr:hypothetical protein [Acidaminococcus fermentans]
MKDEQKRQIIALRRDGAGYRSHGSFSYRLLVCQKFFFTFFGENVRKSILPRLQSGGENDTNPQEGGKAMKQRVSISVSAAKGGGHLAAVRSVSVRERILRFLLGRKEKVTIIVPGDSVEELAIREINEGGN